MNVIIPFDFWIVNPFTLNFYFKIINLSSRIYKRLDREGMCANAEELNRVNLFKKDSYYITHVEYDYCFKIVNYTITNYSDIFLLLLPNKLGEIFRDILTALGTVEKQYYIHLKAFKKEDHNSFMVITPAMIDYNKLLDFIKNNYPEILYI